MHRVSLLLRAAASSSSLPSLASSLTASVSAWQIRRPSTRYVSVTVKRYSTAETREQSTTALILSAETVANLSAFEVRSGILFSSHEKLLAAVTHKSYKPLKPASSFSSTSNNVIDDTTETVQKHVSLGQRLLAFHVTQFLLLSYPRLPAHALDSLLLAYTGDRALAHLGRNIGVELIMRWKQSSHGETASLTDPKLPGQAVVIARVIQSLVGALYLEKGASAVAFFIKTHILSRSVDVAAHLQLSKNPKATLRAVLKEFNRELPVSRLLNETGRLSTNPVFIVGVYSGIDQIGQGYGSSMAMAETRACKNALEKHFVQHIKDIDEEKLLVADEEALSFLTSLSTVASANVENTDDRESDTKQQKNA
ncbi:hypothetical protein HK100_003972, partial [Physocladia obscura]